MRKYKYFSSSTVKSSQVLDLVNKAELWSNFGSSVIKFNSNEIYSKAARKKRLSY
uniref:Uncharacterized protein n=1 Tax=Helianthus annuus TaxID=4232 RepID=A0A251SSQ5_HELAN